VKKAELMRYPWMKRSCWPNRRQPNGSTRPNLQAIGSVSKFFWATGVAKVALERGITLCEGDTLQWGKSGHKRTIIGSMRYRDSEVCSICGPKQPAIQTGLRRLAVGLTVFRVNHR